MIDLTAVVKVNEAHISEKQSNIESLEAELVGVRDDLKSAESQIVELESTNQLLKDEYQALQLALNSAETKLREIQRENEVLVQQLMSLKAQDADRMNFENDMFLKRQQQIMQLELAEAAKEQKSVSPEKIFVGDLVGDCESGLQGGEVVPSKVQMRFEAHEGEIMSCRWDLLGRSVNNK